MSEHPTVTVARDLRAIAEMADHLEAQAVASSTDPEMPGGRAMVALAHVASPEGWGNMQQATERYGYGWTSVDDEQPDSEWEPPLQTLLFWSEAWRTEHGYDLDGWRPTIRLEADWLRGVTGWAWESEPRFDDYAEDIKRARRRLEDVTREGERAERTRVQCDRCDEKPRLIKVYGPACDGTADEWKCPACKVRMDDDGYLRAYRHQMFSAAAATFVSLPDAIGTLRTQGRPERTVRQWVLDGKVESYCERTTHRVLVWWPDVWRLHCETKTRERQPA